MEEHDFSVRLELQADYLAGGMGRTMGKKKFKFIEPGDVEAAIQSANANWRRPAPESAPADSSTPRSSLTEAPPSG